MRRYRVLVLLWIAVGWPVMAVAQPTEQVEYVHVDALGSVRAVTDVYGNVVRRLAGTLRLRAQQSAEVRRSDWHRVRSQVGQWHDALFDQ
jgi:hypothetical protein